MKDVADSDRIEKDCKVVPNSIEVKITRLRSMT